MCMSPYGYSRGFCVSPSATLQSIGKHQIAFVQHGKLDVILNDRVRSSAIRVVKAFLRSVISNSGRWRVLSKD